MRFRTSSGRWFSAPTRDILAVAGRIRAWKIAGERIATAEDLMIELDRVGERHPHHTRRIECMRSYLISALLQSVISIPEAEAVL